VPAAFDAAARPGIIIEEVPASHAHPPPPAAAAAGTAPGLGAAAAAEFIDLGSQAATDERDPTDDTGDDAEASLCTTTPAAAVAAPATDAGPDCASLASSIAQLLQTYQPMLLDVGACKLSVYYQGPKFQAADGRAHKRRRGSSSSTFKKPLQVWIRTPEMMAARQAQKYIWGTDSAGLQQLQRSLRQATCWAEVQHCLQPLVKADMMQKLAAMACHQLQG
jgi:hypothetical protein